MPSSSALPASESRYVQQGAQVGEVEQRQPLLVGVAEDERRHCSWVSLAPRTFASSWGPKSETVARTGTPGPMPPSDEELDREAARA